MENQVSTESKSLIAGKVARIHDLLVYGQFQGSLAKDVVEGREFLTQLHEQMVKEIEAQEKVEVPQAPEVIQPELQSVAGQMVEVAPKKKKKAKNEKN